MNITMDLFELKNLCIEVSEMAVANYIKKTKPGNDLISQREAFRLFQEGRVRRWKEAGIVKSIRSGGSIRSKVLYSMSELMAADSAERLNPILNR